MTATYTGTPSMTKYCSSSLIFWDWSKNQEATVVHACFTDLAIGQIIVAKCNLGEVKLESQCCRCLAHLCKQSVGWAPLDLQGQITSAWASSKHCRSSPANLCQFIQPLPSSLSKFLRILVPFPPTRYRLSLVSMASGNYSTEFLSL